MKDGRRGIGLLQQSDVVLALFVVAISAMLLIPLPTFILDLLLVVNISFSLLLLLVGLYMPNALALLAFPSLLLLTTLFRLSLNVASTRLILSQGDAGTVIQAFGTFLIRGEIVVGVIIFAIITIVNFIVVARGSSRVSEVAARFALDALPGKQMAIDADLRAGLIDPHEAEIKREELRKESQLFGAMDGAMKFVQGDVIAGFFIIITNIIGGLYIGISGGMSFGDAIQSYTVLTVGDGLVSQIPALLISICAGIIVTRVASAENATLGSDVGAQVFQRHGTLLFAGILLFLMALVPALPVLPFVTIGILFIVSSVLVRKNFTRARLEASLSKSHLPQLPGAVNQDNDIEKATEEVFVINLDSAVLYQLYKASSAQYVQFWNVLREDFYNQVGLRLPSFSVSSNSSLLQKNYFIACHHTQLHKGTVPLDAILVEMNPVNAELMGLDYLSSDQHLLNGAKIFWAKDTPAARAILKAARVRFFDFMEVILLRLAGYFRETPDELLSISDVHLALKGIERRYPGLLADVIDQNFLNTSRLTELLQALVREGICIRDLKGIIEAAAAYCATDGHSLLVDSEFDLHDLISYIRVNQRKQFLSLLLSENGTLKSFSISENVEQIFEGLSIQSYAMPLPFSRQTFDKLHSSFQTLTEPFLSYGLGTACILCRPDLRFKVAAFLRSCHSCIRVVTFDELDPIVRVEPLGDWEI